MDRFRCAGNVYRSRVRSSVRYDSEFSVWLRQAIEATHRNSLRCRKAISNMVEHLQAGREFGPGCQCVALLSSSSARARKAGAAHERGCDHRMITRALVAVIFASGLGSSMIVERLKCEGGEQARSLLLGHHAISASARIRSDVQAAADSASPGIYENESRTASTERYISAIHSPLNVARP